MLILILSSIIYLFIGLWICFKRNWYKGWSDRNEGAPDEIALLLGIVFMPLNFIVVFFKYFILKKWQE